MKGLPLSNPTIEEAKSLGLPDNKASLSCQLAVWHQTQLINLILRPACLQLILNIMILQVAVPKHYFLQLRYKLSSAQTNLRGGGLGLGLP